MTPVSIPRMLDLSRFKQTVIDKSCDITEGQYELSSIVVHEGWRLDFGHYYLLAKQSEGLQSERWVQLNDHQVSEALSAEHVDLFASKGAYLLFYSKCHEESDSDQQESR